MARLFVGRRDGWADRIGRRLGGVGPPLAAVLVVVAGFVGLAASMIGLGALLIHVLMPGSLQRWDDSVVQWFASRRTTPFNDLSVIASWLAEILTVVVLGITLAAIW